MTPLLVALILGADPLPEPARKIHEQRLKAAEEAVKLDADLRKAGAPGQTPFDAALAARGMAAVMQVAFESEVALKPDAEAQARKAHRQRLLDLEEFVRIRVPAVLRPQELHWVRARRLAVDAELAATLADRAKALKARHAELQEVVGLQRDVFVAGSIGATPCDASERVVAHFVALAMVRDSALGLAADERERLTARADYFAACREHAEYVRIRTPAVLSKPEDVAAKLQLLGAELAVAEVADLGTIRRERAAVAAEWRKLDDADLKKGFPRYAPVALWVELRVAGRQAVRDAELGVADGPKERAAACLAAVRALAEQERLVAANVAEKATKRDALAATLARLDAELVYVREVGEAPPR